MTRARFLLGAAVLAWAGGLSTLAILRHRAFESGRFDLGNMAQAVWSTAEGRPLEVTGLHGRQVSRLGSHFDPILAALAPLWTLWPDPELLLVVQAAALALGAVPVFLLARKHLRSESAAAALAGAYLLYAPVQWLALADFHPVALATPLLLAAFWFLDEDRLVPFAVCAALAVLAKEQVGLVVAALGAWYAVARGRPREGAAIALAGAAVSALAVLVVIPHFAAGGEAVFTDRYSDPLGSLDRRDAEYLGRLLWPLAGLPLAAPLAALTALPEVALNVLSSARTQTSIHYQYTAGAIPGLVAAAVLGAARFRRAPYAVAAAAGLSTVVLGPLTGLDPDVFRRDAADRAAARAVALVPDDAAVSATNTLGAHLSARRRILSFPRVEGAQWVVADERRASQGDRLSGGTAELRRLRGDRTWELVFDEQGIVVLRRAS